MSASHRLHVLLATPYISKSLKGVARIRSLATQPSTDAGSSSVITVISSMTVSPTQNHDVTTAVVAHLGRRILRTKTQDSSPAHRRNQEFEGAPGFRPLTRGPCVSQACRGGCP